MKEKDKNFEPTRKFNSGVRLYMFQTGSIKTKLKFIKMNQGEEPYEIPVPWFLIKHPEGDVIIDGGMPIEAALDKHKHWGSVVEAYDPVMKVSEWCKDMVKSVNTNPEDVKYVIQTHLHLDHSGAIGHFPNATHITQKLREVDIPKDACKKMASDAMKQTRLLVNNPREVTESDALNIYQSAW